MLYRIVPPAQRRNDGLSVEPHPPLTVTFALTGLGEAQIDSVSIKPLTRGVGGPSVTQITSGKPNFPKPEENLQGKHVQAVPAMTPQPNPTEPTSAWPGMSLEWPKMLPFTAPETTPPQGPSGSTIDPFKRARGTPTKQP